MEEFSRTELLLGREKMERLAAARVAVFGIGGVGGHVVEGLIRSGIGALDLIDNDRVCLSNLNRQIIATHDTMGQYKVDAAKARCLSINPDAVITVHRCFYLPETREQFDFSEYDYVVDAIDTVTGKIALVLQAREAGTPIISAMGAGNKLDPTAFRVADLAETSVCPLARVMRRELKKRGVEHLKVVYSREPAMMPGVYGGENREDPEDSMPPDRTESLPPDRTESPLPDRTESLLPESVPGQTAEGEPERSPRRRQTPGSTSFVPSVAGLIIAGEVVKDLTNPGRRLR